MFIRQRIDRVAHQVLPYALFLSLGYLAALQWNHFSAHEQPGREEARRDMESKKGTAKRYGRVLKLRPEAREKYIEYHANVWPEMLRLIHRYNIRNYSIFLKDDTLFAYFEYVGKDFEADTAKIAADPKSQEWEAIMKPMQQPIPTRKAGEWWAMMQEVFHTD